MLFWEDGTIIENPYVEINGVKHYVQFPKVIGQTSLSAENLNKMQDHVTEFYSSDLTYKVGDYCVYDNTIYKCTTAITEPEEFDSNKWQKTTITEELKCRLEFEVVEETTE